MMTFADTCLICGGPVAVWDEDTAKCVGFCGLKQERIEDLTPEQRRRLVKAAVRRRAIEAAEEIEPKGDRL